MTYSSRGTVQSMVPARFGSLLHLVPNEQWACDPNKDVHHMAAVQSTSLKPEAADSERLSHGLQSRDVSSKRRCNKPGSDFSCL